MASVPDGRRGRDRRRCCSRPDGRPDSSLADCQCRADLRVRAARLVPGGTYRAHVPRPARGTARWQYAERSTARWSHSSAAWPSNDAWQWGRHSGCQPTATGRARRARQPRGPAMVKAQGSKCVCIPRGDALSSVHAVRCCEAPTRRCARAACDAPRAKALLLDLPGPKAHVMCGRCRVRSVPVPDGIFPRLWPLTHALRSLSTASARKTWSRVAGVRLGTGGLARACSAAVQSALAAMVTFAAEAGTGTDAR